MPGLGGMVEYITADPRVDTAVKLPDNVRLISARADSSANLGTLTFHKTEAREGGGCWRSKIIPASLG